MHAERPIVLITGAAGRIGSALVERLAGEYRIVGMDREGMDGPVECLAVDLTNKASIELALHRFRDRYGTGIASVVHLAAYFDFTGEAHPLYEKLNVEGTRLLLEALQDFEVGQFVFSGTMLVHEACAPGERIDEDTPIAPKWAYPKSKAAAEQAIREAHGRIPYVLLRLAGLYDDETAVPTLSHQIARIYERDLKSRLYAGDMRVGQSLIHQDDLVDVIRRTIDRRSDLPEELAILAGEPDAPGYGRLQDEIGRLIHGDEEWATLSVPEAIAKAGAWMETKSEPVIPDELDKGEKPFIRPFMIDMASDHYALDITRAEKCLDWRPRHDILRTLPKIVAALKNDPAGWYRANGITPPDWLQSADEKNRDPEKLRVSYEARYREQHASYLWAHFINMGLGAWLLTSPGILGYRSEWLAISDIAAGAAVILLSLLSLSWRLGGVRWVTAAVGLWVLFAPLAFWAPTAAGYLNGTLVGGLVIGFAVLLPPTPGIDPAAAMTGPTRPQGWDYSPSGWLQRIPIVALAFVGLFISRHLAAYQLGHIDGIWDPFFAGSSAAKNGSEEITTSFVSEAWPVSDAGLGGYVYMLEILTGIVGSAQRWRTMPWLVIAFGIMIVPLGAVSITFIIIQPILIGTWCTLCLVAAAAMLLQIPYALDELVASCELLWRRWKEGRPFLRILFRGDPEDGATRFESDDFERPFTEIARDMLTRNLTVSWRQLACIAIGVSLMFTRVTLGTTGGMANADHLIGSLVITVTVIAFAELGRVVRFLNMPLGAALLVTPFVYDAAWPAVLHSLAAGLALIVLSVPRGRVLNAYGRSQKLVV